MKDEIKNMIAKGFNTRDKLRKKLRGQLVTRVDAQINAMLFSGEIKSYGGVFFA